MRIDGNTPAVVTGAASGLGAATARALAAAGAPVAILDMDAERGKAAAAEIDGLFVETDVTSDGSVDAALAAATERLGVPRICVNCAGVAPAAKTVGRDGPHDMKLFERVIGINLSGTMRVMSRAAALMAEAGPLDSDGARGVIVNTASIAAYEGQMGQTAYAASKGGVAALTLPAARDLARHGIRVNAIAPGIFGTPMLRGLPEDVQESLAAQAPFPARLGEPEEFAKTVLFLVTTAYVNGAVLRIDAAMRMGAK
jgi:NAD(P)-dependent dehydrogenase (short-subunit alcohol dehydrogenase family)